MAAVPAFKPTVINQAGQDALKQSLQGVSFSNVTPAPTQRPLIGPTLSGDHPMVNVPAPVSGSAVSAPTNQPPTSFTGTLPGPYPSYDANGKVSSVQAGMKIVNGVPQPNVPAPTGLSVPKFDAAGIAASRVAAQRAALAASVNAYDTSRTSAYKYAQGTTQGNRALLQFDNSNRGDQFGGSAREDLFRLQRSQGIEDTAANAAYQNDLAASDAKLAAFDAGSAGLTQDIQSQLEHQNLTDTLATNQDTRAQKTQDHGFAQDSIANNRNAANDTATYTGNYTSPETMAIQQQMAKNSAAYASASPSEQIRLHNENLALGKQLGQTYDPNTGTYSGGNGSVRTVAGQTLDMNNAKDMATLTGYMSDGKGGYIPTNVKQQQDLANAWTATNNLGSVTPELARLTGIKVGTPTQQAINQSQQIAVSNRNATNSENGTSNSNNNAKINQLMEVWKNTGVAPAGLESVGVKQGDKYTGGNPSSTGNFNLDDYKGHINSVFYSNEPSDPNDPSSPKTKVFDKAAAQKYVDSLNLPKDQKNQLYQIYGLQAVSDSDISQYLK